MLEYFHTGRIGVLQGESKGVKSPSVRRQVMIGLRPRLWVLEIGNWGLEGKDEGSLR